MYFYLLSYHVSHLVKNTGLLKKKKKKKEYRSPAIEETLVQFLCQEDPWGMGRLPTPIFLCFPGVSDGKDSTCNRGDLGSIPVFGRSPGEKNSYPLQ